jgi:hypothetical protein
MAPLWSMSPSGIVSRQTPPSAPGNRPPMRRSVWPLARTAELCTAFLRAWRAMLLLGNTSDEGSAAPEGVSNGGHRSRFV